MQLLTFLSFAFAALVSADTTTTADNPAVSLLTETNSVGVVTGHLTAASSQPSAVTTQPDVATSQTTAAFIPQGYSGLYTYTTGNTTQTYSADGSTAILLTPTPTAASATGSGASASGTGSSSSSTGAAAAGHIKAGMGALAAAGGFFAIFL